MALKQVLEAFDVMDGSDVSGDDIIALLKENHVHEIEKEVVAGPRGKTDFLRILVPGRSGKSGGGNAPTLGIIGRLGGIGARPEQTGFVSDGDGALAAIAAAMKLGRMGKRGDTLPGDVVITTHICPDAPTRPHEPVPFMDSPVAHVQALAAEKDARMEAILSVDTTKGNRVINHKGFAISPTVKEGYILRVSEDLLGIMQTSTGHLPAVLPITTQDITPYGNGIHHLNSIMQPSVATKAPTVGVAITTESAVPGCATGASHMPDIAMTVRFLIEVAKAFTSGRCSLYDEKEFALLQAKYGSMAHLQTGGKS